jgi:uncharacterized membrane protein YidH (DUF202 family)
VAGWNTFAQIHNTYQVFTSIGPAFENVGSFFSGAFSGSSDDDDNPRAKLGVFVIVLVVASILLGFLVATMIVVKTARAEAKVFAETLKPGSD